MTLKNITCVLMTGLLLGCQLLGASYADENNVGVKQLNNPVFRVAKNVGQKAIKENPAEGHPIDAALKIAQSSIDHIDQNIRDYTVKLVKRETVNGKLLPQEYIFMKVRNRQVNEDGRTIVPFSVYMSYLAPRKKKGQEAIWVEGENNGKIVAHGTGITGWFTVYLNPDGPLATNDTNYRIYDSGIRNLVKKLIEKGHRDRRHGECQLQFFENTKINGRPCTLIQVTHPIEREHFDFHIARIFIDKENNVPVRYAAWGWPEVAGGTPVKIEEFTYVDLKLNVGLTNADFNHKNPDYRYR